MTIRDVVMAANGTLASSADALTFTPATAPVLPGTPSMVDYVPMLGLWLAYDNLGNVCRSSDGVTWSAAVATGGINITARTAWSRSLILALGQQGKGGSSADGVTWTARDAGFGIGYCNGVTYGAGLFVAVGYSDVGLTPLVRTSPDGITWTTRTTPTTGYINGIVFIGDRFVAISSNPGANGGVCLTSTNGITWTARMFPGSEIPDCLCFGAGLFVAGGHAGGIITTPDGITWTTRSPIPNMSQVYAISYDSANRRFVAVGDGSKDLATSADALTWNTPSSPLTTPIRASGSRMIPTSSALLALL